MGNDTESSHYERGSIGEQNVGVFLKRNGWAVLPAHECNPGNAALLQGADDSFVLPDLLSFNSRQRIWAESKVKEKSQLYRKRNEYRHCIDEYNYKEYLAVQSLTGIPVWVFIYEEDTQKLIRAPLNWVPVVQRLSPEESDFKFDEPIVLFRRNDFIDTGVGVIDGEVETGLTIDRNLRNPPPNDPFAA
jgi:Holliday junction resolvase